MFNKYFSCAGLDMNKLYFGHAINRISLEKQCKDFIWLCLEKVNPSSMLIYFSETLHLWNLSNLRNSK